MRIIKAIASLPVGILVGIFVGITLPILFACICFTENVWFWNKRGELK